MDSKFDQSLAMLPNSYHNQQQEIVTVKAKRTFIQEVVLFWQFMVGSHKIYKQYKVLK